MRYDHVDDQHPDFEIVCEADEVMAFWYGGDWHAEPDPVREIEFHLHVEDVRKRGVSTLARLDADGAGAHQRRIRRQAESIHAEETALTLFFKTNNARVH